MDNYSILSRAIGEAFEPKLDEFIDSVNFDVNAEFSEKFERKMDKLIRRRNKPYFNLPFSHTFFLICSSITSNTRGTIAK